MSPNTSSPTTFVPFSSSQRSGAAVIAVFALLSTLALVFIVLRTVRLVFFEGNKTSRPPEILFFRTQLGHYAGCLILGNLFISAAGLINFTWISRSGLSQGSLCSAQAAFTQIGIWSTCWFTAAHGIHNLCLLGLHVRPPRWRSSASIAVGWIIAFVAGLVPLQAYGPTETSCGITSSYSKDIFSLESLPIILGALASIVVYSVQFAILRGKLRVGDTKASSNGQGSEEYYKFISMIIWTMFWFPLAFVLLLLPFCFMHIVMSAGGLVSSAASVFVDVCLSMLGIVNVGLLYNTLRVIGSVYRGSGGAGVMAETVKTFGNDASFESPINQQPKFPFQVAASSYENSHQTSNSSNHSRNDSWSSVDSNTGLLKAEKASYESTHANVEPGRRRKPSTNSQRNERRSTFKSKAPPSLDLSRLSVMPPLLSSREVRNKSARLAVQLGIPTVPSAQQHVKGDARVPAPSVSQVPRIDVTPLNSIDADTRKTRRSSSSSITSTSTLDYDSDPDYHGEIMQVRKVRPLPRLPRRSDEEQANAVEAVSVPKPVRTWSCRTSVTSVWSQETGYTMSQSLDVKHQSHWKRASSNHHVMLGDEENVYRVV